MIVCVPVKDKRVWARLEPVARNFTPGSEGGQQKIQAKVTPSRAAWDNSLRTRQDTAARYRETLPANHPANGAPSL
jgi:hypothetical protein